MDPRQSLSRTSSSNVPQNAYNPNGMASAYAMPPYHSNTHLPPINYSQLPPANQSYMHQQYRDVPRYTSAPAPAPIPTGTQDRYTPQMAQQSGPMSGLPPASMLPQPPNHGQQTQGYQGQPPQPARQSSYPQPLAPAPPRPNLNSMGSGYPQPDERQQAWSAPESMPGGVASDGGRDPNRVHVVGSQGRRGILPSAPGRPAVVANGVNGAPRTNAIPIKDADGKFPCPNCTKTYLHAKHLKRHMLRHTGDRPYMCVLCNDTFSRSDILKRHFQKCSVRRGNPTGASHLSNPAAHLKKTQAAAAKAVTGSPSSANTPSSTGMPSGPFTSAAMSNNSIPTTQAPPQMSYNMAPNGQGDVQRGPHGQPMQSSPAGPQMDPNAGGAWGMHNPRGNQMMYHSTSASPVQFSMPQGGADDKRNVMPNSHPMGDEWNQMFPAGQEGYMNPMFGGYDQSQNDVKKEYDGHDGGSNGYYIPSTSLGADGTLAPPLWNSSFAQEDPFQVKTDRLVDFCFPAGIQESLQEQQNNFHVRSCLTPDAIKHFLELYPNFQGHFPWLHLPTFDLLRAYDGLALVIICSGAVYSDRVSQYQVRALLHQVQLGIERTAQVLRNISPDPTIRRSITPMEHDELLAMLMLHSLTIWHGSAEERAVAITGTHTVLKLIRKFNMLTLGGSDDDRTLSYLHHLAPGEQADPSQWDWHRWVEQEKRSRLMFLAFTFDAALCLYFNVPPHFTPSEIRLPLPCDDAAWEATDSETCARALGLRGTPLQSRVNVTGSLRLKQLEMHHAMSALHTTTVSILPRTTNVYSKFILIHALHMEIWQCQRERLYHPQSTSTYSSNSAAVMAQHHKMLASVNTALDRWKQCWDVDIRLQYPSNHGYDDRGPKRFGFCRDGVHFYWLALALLQSPRATDWELPPDTRFRQIMAGLKKAREWSRNDGLLRGEQPGSIFDIDDNYVSETTELDMRKLFRPLIDVLNSRPSSR